MSGRLDPAWVVLAFVAVVVGTWLGVAGADVSPNFTQAPASTGPAGSAGPAGPAGARP